MKFTIRSYIRRFNNNFDMLKNRVVFIFVSLGAFLLLVYTGNTLYSLEHSHDRFAVFGESFNGITAPFIGLVGTLLIYFSFKEQVQTNKVQFDLIHYQREFDLALRLLDSYEKNCQALQSLNYTIVPDGIHVEDSLKVRKVNSEKFLGYFNSVISDLSFIVKSLDKGVYIESDAMLLRHRIASINQSYMNPVFAQQLSEEYFRGEVEGKLNKYSIPADVFLNGNYDIEPFMDHMREMSERYNDLYVLYADLIEKVGGSIKQFKFGSFNTGYEFND